ncbi:DUF2088 domain-containing protein [bacterium]|nr:DUF2088 domain-containing protein [bacterium]
MELFLSSENGNIKDEDIIKSLIEVLDTKAPKKLLILPPDYTRFHSKAGFITNVLYHECIKREIYVDIMPALGTHEAITLEQKNEMFGDIPLEKFLYHDWRNDVVKIGEVPKEYVSSVTEGLWEKPVDVEVNKIIMDESYDLILSVGQVVPHEVVGMANHAKNLFVGCGGRSMINSSHIIGAVYGMERMMGRDNTPVRKIFDYSFNHFLKNRPITFILTVTTNEHGKINTHGLFISENRNGLEAAIELSSKYNFNYVNKPIKKCIVYLDEKEFRSTWLGNKAIYRTRMAIATGGELIILAPGITKFGEDEGVDVLIRKYGYVGRLKVLDLLNKNQDLKENTSVAAHLIHGSSDDRFKVYYAVKNITQEEIKNVNFIPLDYNKVIKKYDPSKLKDGYNNVDGEEIYFISNPALGLWMYKE